VRPLRILLVDVRKKVTCATSSSRKGRRKGERGLAPLRARKKKTLKPICGHALRGWKKKGLFPHKRKEGGREGSIPSHVDREEKTPAPRGGENKETPHLPFSTS